MCLDEQEALSEGDSFDRNTNAELRAADQHLLYYGAERVSVRGPVTGRLYQFSRQQPLQTVDPRDAVSMLKTRLFRRIR
jgi:hypothetical protein